MDPRAERIYGAAEYVRQQIGDLKPEVGIVLGSGLGKLADSISDPLTIPYKTIPGFPVSTAIGHKGNFIVGKLGGKTVIAIAHRLSTIARMDRLVVMERGAVVETGTHAELVARDGLYARLWKRQTGGFVAADL